VFLSEGFERGIAGGVEILDASCTSVDDVVTPPSIREYPFLDFDRRRQGIRSLTFTTESRDRETSH